MKTATEVLTEIHPKPEKGELQYAWVIQAMKVYANAKLDEAKLLMPDFNYVNKNLLDSLKDQI